MTNSERVHNLRELCEELARALKDWLDYGNALHGDHSLVIKNNERAVLIEEGASAMRNFERTFRPEVITPDESD